MEDIMDTSIARWGCKATNRTGGPHYARVLGDVMAMSPGITMISI
jgi:hypothetical protein